MHKNSYTPVINAAVRAASDAIQGSTGAGNAFQSGVVGSGAPAQSLTFQNPETGQTMWGFMIGVDGIGDENATFLSDGKTYDFGS